MADVSVTTTGSVFSDKREIPLDSFRVVIQDGNVLVKGLVVETVPGSEGGDEDTATVEIGDFVYLDKTTAIALAAAIDTAANTL